MLRRYAIPCAALVLIAVVIAFTTYKLTPVNFTGTCTFTVSLPVTQAAATTDVINFENDSAANEVGQAGRADIYSGPAGAVGLEPATAAGEVTLAQAPGSSDFVLVVSDSDPDRAKSLANRMCDAYVQRVGAQLQQQRDSEVTQLQSKITQLDSSIQQISATPESQRSAADNSFLKAQQAAVGADQQLMATVLALPADNVNVLTRAPGGVRNDTRSLTRNLLVAGVSALLASFLVVLIGEMVRDQRADERR